MQETAVIFWITLWLVPTVLFMLARLQREREDPWENDLSWQEDPYCKRCGRRIEDPDRAELYHCERCAKKIGLR